MKRYILLSLLSLITLASCKVSYQFNGASIDYNLVKTMQISDFQNQALNQYAPLLQTFNEKLRDIYSRNTKLQFTSVSPDMQLEGEITKYELTPLGIGADAISNQTRLTMDVRIRFRNNKNPDEDKEQTFSAYQDFSSSVMIDNVQDQLINDLTNEIVDQIFNATMANW